MAALAPVTQRIFAINSGTNEVSQFGSLANSTPNFTLDPTVIQALPEWLDGWYQAVLGNNSPAMQDMNAFFYLVTYQLAYLKEKGISQWLSTTTYYIGSIVQDGTGGQYLSILDNNLNNALGTIGWFPIGTVGPVTATMGNGTFPANRRISSPSPITLNASTTVNVPSTTIVNVPESVIVPAGSSLIVASGGSVRVS